MEVSKSDIMSGSMTQASLEADFHPLVSIFIFLFCPCIYFGQIFSLNWCLNETALCASGACVPRTLVRRNTFLVASSEILVPCLNVEFSRSRIVCASSVAAEIFSSATLFSVAVGNASGILSTSFVPFLLSVRLSLLF